MPELPEVERAARALRESAVGGTIKSVRTLHPSLVRTLPPADVRRVRGRTIVAVERRGKHQLIRLDDGSTLAAHFRMTGDWWIGSSGDVQPPLSRAIIELDGGARIALVDGRALATLVLHGPGSDPLPRLGPEPTAPGFDADYLRDVLSKRRGPIKPVLLDQRVVAGLGNIYAAEALWEARISPSARAASVSRARLDRLVIAIREVLDRAPGARYSEDAASAEWRVYDREGEPCARCGSRIARIVQAARSTYYCRRCQRG